MAYLLASGTTALFKGVLLSLKMDNQGIENLKICTWCTRGIFSLKADKTPPRNTGPREGERKNKPKQFFSSFKRTAPALAFLMNHKTGKGGSREKQKLDFYLSVTFSSTSADKQLRYLPFTCCMQ